MDLKPREVGLLDAYVAPFTRLARDRRTAGLLGAIVHGVIGGESLVCSRIAAFSPSARCQPVRCPAHSSDAHRANHQALRA